MWDGGRGGLSPVSVSRRILTISLTELEARGGVECCTLAGPQLLLNLGHIHAFTIQVKCLKNLLEVSLKR